MLDVRLARLALPLPLEIAIGRALMQRERAAQHEGLVLAWELAVRILAGSLWSACRHTGASSPALEKAASKLERPSLGHWVELARTSAALLRETNHPTATAFETTLAGLEQSLPDECGLRALANRVALLDGAPPRPRRVQEALDLLPAYRNAAQSTHKQIAASFREESVPALLEGLIDLCERVPLIGRFSLVLAGRLERTARGGTAELARLHGTFLTWETRELSEPVWSTLLSSRPYLFREPDLVVPLFPVAAAAASGGEWHVGWYARAVHVPTVAYQSAGGHEFQLALAPDELASLAGTSAGKTDDAALSAALRLEPFRGLLAYDEEHAAIFFGREEETEAAVARIEQRGALLVYGASGSGKSSWLRAGIVPALRARATLAGRSFLPIVLFPGDRPLASLRRALTLARGGAPEEAAAWARAVDEALPEDAAMVNERGLAHLLRGLAAGGSQPVLVVDQLEEAALQALDPAESRAFLGLVAGAARAAKDLGAIVLASMRADLLAPLIEHEALRAALQADGWPIGSIAPERLARVITEPLRGRKTPIEPGLPEIILADVANEPGSLALLSQVLTTLWTERARFGGGLTKQGYVDAGRVSGALETQAEAALAEACAAGGAGVEKRVDARVAKRVDRDVEKRVDRLFRALAQSDENEHFTRRRVALATLASELSTTAPSLRALAQPFVARRLVVLAGEAGKETVEVSHERLLDAWTRLRTLLASEREVLELRRHVENASAAWVASGGRKELWTDATSKLRRSEELLATERLDLDERGRAFLAASRAAARRRQRVERTAIAALVVLTLSAGAAAWYAHVQSQRAEKKTAEAQGLTETLLARDRDARVQGLISELAYFETLDDDVYARAPWRSEPASAWWMRRAHELVEGVTEDANHPDAWRPGLRFVEQKLEKLRESARERTPEEVASDRAAGERRTWHFDDSQREWLHGELSKLVEGLRRVSKQLEYARASVEDPEALRAWSEAIEAIAVSEKYQGTKWPGGAQLTPQLGLVPIGADPDTGLWEFAHLASGAPARRGADRRIRLDPAMGLVFVLLPGGHVPTANSADQKQDPTIAGFALDAFFVSKYEMTASQWARIDGWRRYRAAPGEADSLLPTAEVSWDDCQIALLRNAGWLRLSTEVQWEYACRATTQTTWWTGDDREKLKEAAHLQSKLHEIGQLKANAFGLYDVHGNVWEWCQDAFDNEDGKRRAGDGLHDEQSAAYRVYRGGAYWDEAVRARSSFRDDYTPDFRYGVNGLRPTRGITP